MVEQDVESLFMKITFHRMKDLYSLKLKVALSELTTKNLWSESYSGSNSIGGIVLHICEHVNRSCLRLSGLEKELKAGFESYFPNQNQTSEQLIALFEEQLHKWELVVGRYIVKEQVVEQEHIHHLYHLVEHTGYHLGQIIDRAQWCTGKKFSFCENGVNEAYLRSKLDNNSI